MQLDDPKHGIVCDDDELLTHHGIHRHVTQEAPRRVVIGAHFIGAHFTIGMDIYV